MTSTTKIMKQLVQRHKDVNFSSGPLVLSSPSVGCCYVTAGGSRIIRCAMILWAPVNGHLLPSKRMLDLGQFDLGKSWFFRLRPMVDLGQFDSSQLAHIVDFVLCVCLCVCLCCCVLCCCVVGPRFGCSSRPPIRRTAPPPDRPSSGPPKISLFFPSPAPISFFFCLSGCLGGFGAARARTPNVHISGTWPSKHQNSTQGPPRERRKKEHCGGRGKKSAKFWALHPSGPHPCMNCVCPPRKTGGWGEGGYWPKSNKSL